MVHVDVLGLPDYLYLCDTPAFNTKRVCDAYRPAGRRIFLEFQSGFEWVIHFLAMRNCCDDSSISGRLEQCRWLPENRLTISVYRCVPCALEPTPRRRKREQTGITYTFQNANLTQTTFRMKSTKCTLLYRHSLLYIASFVCFCFLRYSAHCFMQIDMHAQNDGFHHSECNPGQKKKTLNSEKKLRDQLKNAAMDFLLCADCVVRCDC